MLRVGLIALLLVCLTSCGGGGSFDFNEIKDEVGETLTQTGDTLQDAAGEVGETVEQGVNEVGNELEDLGNLVG